MNVEYITQQFTKSIDTYDQSAVAQKQIALKLMNLAKPFLSRNLNEVLEFGCGTGLLTEQLLKQDNIKRLYLNDLSLDFYQYIVAKYLINSKANVKYIEGDISCIDWPNTFDLVISSSTEQWISNKKSFYKNVHSHLNEGGMFIFSSFGKANLKELQRILPQQLKYFDEEESIQILSEIFNVRHSESQSIVIEFDSAMDLLKHFKLTGVNGLYKRSWSKAEINLLIKTIEQRKQTDRFQLTYQATFYILEKK
ncbi:MAG: methyltransferase domain-containing protein [Bacteroidales bacterium]|nr:methyltransferase domain-containing protein [Bacteroidales bacterium]